MLQELNEFHFTPDSENPIFLRIYMAPVKEEKDAYMNYEEPKEHHHHNDHCDDDECDCHHNDS